MSNHDDDDNTPEGFHRIRASATPDNPIGVMEFVCGTCRDEWLSRQPSEPCALYGIPGPVLEHIRENPTHLVGFVIHDHPVPVDERLFEGHPGFGESFSNDTDADVGDADDAEMETYTQGEDVEVDEAFREAAAALAKYIRYRVENHPSTTTHAPPAFFARPKKHRVD